MNIMDHVMTRLAFNDVDANVNIMTDSFLFRNDDLNCLKYRF